MQAQLRTLPQIRPGLLDRVNAFGRGASMNLVKSATRLRHRAEATLDSWPRNSQGGGGAVDSISDRVLLFKNGIFLKLVLSCVFEQTTQDRPPLLSTGRGAGPPHRGPPDPRPRGGRRRGRRGPWAFAILITIVVL